MAVAVGTCSIVLVKVVCEAANVPWAKAEDIFATALEASLTAAVAVAGCICTSRTITSAGRSLYHCGMTSPVGRIILVPVAVGIAVLRTERTESLVGSMVAGSIARATRSATAWTLGCTVEAAALTARMLTERIVVDFMFVVRYAVLFIVILCGVACPCKESVVTVVAVGVLTNKAVATCCRRAPVKVETVKVKMSSR